MGKRIRLGCRLGGSFGLLAWLAWRTDWDQMGNAFRHLRWELWLAGVGVYVGTQVLCSWRWRLLAQTLGFARPLGHYVAFYFIALFCNLFLPGAVAGDVARALYLDGGSGRRLAALASVAADRLSGLLALALAAGLGLALYPWELPGWLRLAVWGMVAGVLAGLLALPWLVHRAGQWRRLEDLAWAYRVYRSHPRLALTTSLVSLAVQAGTVGIFWLIGQALDLPVPATYYLVLVPVLSLVSMLPVSVNGIGVREAAAVLLLEPLGVSGGAAVSLGFLSLAAFSVAGLGGLGFYLFGKFPQSRPLKSGETAPPEPEPDPVLAPVPR